MKAPSFFLSCAQLLRRNQWRLGILFCGILLPLLVFGSAAAAIHLQGGLPFDLPLLKYIHRYANPERDMLIALLTRWGYVLAIPVLTTVALGIRWFLKRPEEATFFSVAVLGSCGLSLLTKALFQRARPQEWVSAAPESSYSFPSGHALMSMTVACVLVFILWPTRLRWPGLISAVPCVLGIGLSRLYLGVHYPSDILAGWCTGALWVTGVHWILYRRGSPPERKLPY